VHLKKNKCVRRTSSYFKKKRSPAFVTIFNLHASLYNKKMFHHISAPFIDDMIHPSEEFIGCSRKPESPRS